MFNVNEPRRGENGVHRIELSLERKTKEKSCWLNYLLLVKIIHNITHGMTYYKTYRSIVLVPFYITP